MTVSTPNRVRKFPCEQPQQFPDIPFYIGGSYVLMFGSLDVKHEVYPKLLSKLISRLNDEAINREIFNRLAGQKLFDLVELKDILDHRITETARITKLLWAFTNRSPREILSFLTFLCNLENDMQVTALAVRTIINTHFPNSVLPVKRRKILRRLNKNAEQAITSSRLGKGSKNSMLERTHSMLSLDMLVDNDSQLKHINGNCCKRPKMDEASWSYGENIENQENTLRIESPDCSENSSVAGSASNAAGIRRKKKNGNDKTSLNEDDHKFSMNCHSTPAVHLQHDSLTSVFEITKEPNRSTHQILNAHYVNSTYPAFSVESGWPFANQILDENFNTEIETEFHDGLLLTGSSASPNHFNATALRQEAKTATFEQSESPFSLEKALLVTEQTENDHHHRNEKNCTSCWQRIRNKFSFRKLAYIVVAGLCIYCIVEVKLLRNFFGMNGKEMKDLSTLPVSNASYVEYDNSSAHLPNIVETEVKNHGLYSYNYSWADKLLK